MSPPLPPRSEAPFPLSERELVAMLALTQALQALGVDSMLPALGQIAHDLGVSNPNHRQLVVGLFLVGTAVGTLLPGPLADRYGRRRVLIAGILLYIALTFACALVSEFNTLVTLRVLAGLACSALTVVPIAVIRDRFDGDRMARLQSLMAVIFLVVPMLAPTLGQAILTFASWRWIFGLIGGAGAGIAVWVALRLPETLRPANRQPIKPRVIGANMVGALTNRASTGYVLGSAGTTGVLWGYIQSCQQLIAEHFGAGARFPLIFGGMALGMAIANFGNARIVMRFGARRVGQTALLANIAISAVQVWLAHRPDETLWEFVPLMLLNMMMLGFITANFTSIALQPFARSAGAASSAQAFVRLVTGSVIGAAVGQAYDQSARPLAHALLLAGLCALALVLWSERGRLFRRLNPPGTPQPV